jgi:hypothetical protein
MPGADALHVANVLLSAFGKDTAVGAFLSSLRDQEAGSGINFCGSLNAQHIPGMAENVGLYNLIIAHVFMFLNKGSSKVEAAQAFKKAVRLPGESFLVFSRRLRMLSTLAGGGENVDRNEATLLEFFQTVEVLSPPSAPLPGKLVEALKARLAVCGLGLRGPLEHATPSVTDCFQFRVKIFDAVWSELEREGGLGSAGVKSVAATDKSDNSARQQGDKRRQRARGDGKACYSCNGQGHLARECPMRTDRCLRCGTAGHYVRECSVADRVAKKISPAAAGYAEYKCRHCNATMADSNPCDHLGWWCAKNPMPSAGRGDPTAAGKNSGSAAGKNSGSPAGKNTGTVDPKKVAGVSDEQLAMFQNFLEFQKAAAGHKQSKGRRVPAGAFAALKAPNASSSETGSEEESD